MHLQLVMFEILILTLIFLMKIPKHNFEFSINPKITVHCTFSSDSDEETGEFPIPLKKEVRYGAPTLRFLYCNYIYANLPLCEMTGQEKGRESSRPPQVEVFQAAGSLLLLKRKRRRFVLKRRILKKIVCS